MDRRLLKAGRVALGWSQADLAERAGVQRLVVVRFENGRQVPHSRTMESLIAALKVGGVEEIRREDGAAGIVLRADVYAQGYVDRPNET
ncbi:helix-turn-helix transcriptional regulator [Methylobacterium sp. Leaf456]|uniref:helix-turn-helix transcriptional regulator n=1 Tax=Methylobacterium sp. Leaf456 TaxID=1736382 RepID=UPI0009ECB414